jgi:hypothetical protein
MYALYKCSQRLRNDRHQSEDWRQSSLKTGQKKNSIWLVEKTQPWRKVR